MSQRSRQDQRSDGKHCSERLSSSPLSRPGQKSDSVTVLMPSRSDTLPYSGRQQSEHARDAMFLKVEEMATEIMKDPEQTKVLLPWLANITEDHTMKCFLEELQKNRTEVVLEKYASDKQVQRKLLSSWAEISQSLPRLGGDPHDQHSVALKLGDVVSVFSVTADSWVPAEVVDFAEDGRIRVEYKNKTSGLLCGKTMHVQSEHLKQNAEEATGRISASRPHDVEDEEEVDPESLSLFQRADRYFHPEPYGVINGSYRSQVDYRREIKRAQDAGTMWDGRDESHNARDRRRHPWAWKYDRCRKCGTTYCSCMS